MSKLNLLQRRTVYQDVLVANQNYWKLWRKMFGNAKQGNLLF
jgi:ABC-type phosphate/phosphonate transport system ATPase subunit